MTHKPNATCAICGKEYYKCMSCKSIADLNPWQNHTDTSEHYKVYQIIHGRSIGVLNDSETRERLQNVDLSDLHEFRPHIKDIIDRVMGDNVVEVSDVESVDIKTMNSKKKRKAVCDVDSDKE